MSNKTYNTVLTEASELFQSQGISIIGEGYKEIASNPVLFENYVTMLTDGLDADNAANLAQLMENANKQTLTESSITGIQPIASLTMPVIRKLWPKFALKEAIKNEVATSPRLVVAYTVPYMYKGEDIEANRIYLPKGTKADNESFDGDGDGVSDLALGKRALNKNMTRGHIVNSEVAGADKGILKAGTIAKIDFAYQNGISGDLDEEVYIADSPSAAKLQPLDELFFKAYVIGAKVAKADAVATKSYVAWGADRFNEDKRDGAYTRPGFAVITGAAATEDDTLFELVEEVKIGKRLSVYGTQVYNFKNGQLIVVFDGKERTATFSVIGADLFIGTWAAVSSEYNESSYTMTYDIKRQDIDIPTGQHLNASLPIERLNDTMALYQIDGTKEITDLMTNLFAQQLDLEVLDFIEDSFINQPGNEAFNGYKPYGEYFFTFDCKPAAGFAGSPKAWREEIKPVIDHLAQKIKNNTYLQAGTFSIVANPLDVQILANVDWQFRGGQGGNVDGVDVDYSIGTYVGANTYKVIASTNVPAGSMYIIFTPSGDSQFTYKYFAYTFTTELGYTDPNHSRVPSIMMTKRHTFYEFMPAVGCIYIKNNNGAWFNQYVSTKAVA